MKDFLPRTYFNIYFSQAAMLALNLFGLVIVMPRISVVPQSYGIYAFVFSITVALSYIDLGFVTAGYKYAAERYACQDQAGEARILGFVSFLLLIAVVCFAAAVLAVCRHPQLIMSRLVEAGDKALASRLLVILAVFSPVIVLQRFCQIAYGIRLDDFLYLRILIVASALKISSVFYFFSPARYEIAGYFLFCQCVDLAANSAAFLQAQGKYRYDLKLLLGAVRFSPETFAGMKRLAFGSLFITLAFVVYYEMDLFLVGKLMGPQSVALYAVGFTLLTFLRGIFAMVYSPFTARFNHYVGLGDMEGMRGLFRRVVVYTVPLVVVPVAALAVFMKPLIVSWVGLSYLGSVRAAQILVFSFLFNFIANPAGTLLLAQERIKTCSIISLCAVIVYILGVSAAGISGNFELVAVAKFLACTAAAAGYVIVSRSFFSEGLRGLFSTIIRKLAFPLTWLVLVLVLLQRTIVFPGKSASGFLRVSGVLFLSSLFSLAAYYLASPEFLTLTGIKRARKQDRL